MPRSGAATDRGTPTYPPLYTPFKWLTRQLTPLLRDTPLSSDLVTLGWGTLLVVAAVMLAAGESWVAAALILVAVTLDCLDGDLARSREQPSLAGTYLEQIAHCVGNMALVAGAGSALLLADQERRDVAVVAVLAVAQAVYIAVVRQIRPDTPRLAARTAHHRALTIAARTLWYLSPIELPIISALIIFGPSRVTLTVLAGVLILASAALFVPHFTLVRADDRRRWKASTSSADPAPHDDALTRRVMETEWWVPGVPCLPSHVRAVLGAPTIAAGAPFLSKVRRDLDADLPTLFGTSGAVTPLVCQQSLIRAGLIESLCSPGSTVLLVGGRSAVTSWSPVVEQSRRGVAAAQRPFGQNLDLAEIEGLRDSGFSIDLVIVTTADPEDGVLLDLPATVDACRRLGASIVLDASLGFLSDELCMDAWNVDVTVASAVAGALAPENMSLVARRDRAGTVERTTATPLDLLLSGSDALLANSLLGLHSAVAQVRGAGLDALVHRQQAQATTLRAIIRDGAGVEPVAHHGTAACTTYLLPEHLVLPKVLNRLWQEARVVVGQGRTPDGQPTLNIGHSPLRHDAAVERMASALVRVLRPG